jgi:hypothetical protein
MFRMVLVDHVLIFKIISIGAIILNSYAVAIASGVIVSVLYVKG